MNYLLAAEAAQQRGDEARANQHLERATELAGDDLIPVEITRVRLQLARNENHAARHGIDKLLEITPRHPGGPAPRRAGLHSYRRLEFAAGYHSINGESQRQR